VVTATRNRTWNSVQNRSLNFAAILSHCSRLIPPLHVQILWSDFLPHTISVLWVLIFSKSIFLCHVIKFIFSESCWLSYPLLLISDLCALYSLSETTVTVWGCRLRKTSSKCSYFYIFIPVRKWNKLLTCVTNKMEFVGRGQYNTIHHFNPAVFFYYFFVENQEFSRTLYCSTHVYLYSKSGNKSPIY